MGHVTSRPIRSTQGFCLVLGQLWYLRSPVQEQTEETKYLQHTQLGEGEPQKDEKNSYRFNISSQVISQHPQSHVMLLMHLSNAVIKTALKLCDLPPQSPKPSPILRKPSESADIPVKGNSLTSPPHNCQVIKRKVRNCHNQEEPEETCQLNAVCCLGWHRELKKDIRLKLKTLVNNAVSILVH